MTMLAMWLDELSVALATDGKMGGGVTVPVQKLHIVRPNKVMFGIGFGTDEAFRWLTSCSCGQKHAYPEHWRDCSRAKNTNELEQIIRNDLQVAACPTGCELQIWLAGANKQGNLEAFILDESGHRTCEAKPSTATFNITIKLECRRIGIQPEQIFQTLKGAMDGRIKFSGANALIETSRRLIGFCEACSSPYIGGPFQCYMILR